MYGGLFGDLPAAKTGKEAEIKKEGSEDVSSTVDSATSTDDRSSKANTSKNKRPSPPNAMFLFPQTTQKKVKASITSISKAIGAAGTSRAFLPTALRQKQQPPPPKSKVFAAKPLETPKSGVVNAAVTGAAAASNDEICSQPTGSMFQLAMTPIATTMIKLQTSSLGEVAASGPIDIHGDTNGGDNTETAMARRTVSSSSAFESAPTIEEVTDPYDPYTPNDLLQYWDRQALAEERHRLEHETQQALEQQVRLREQLEYERQALQQSGQYTALATVAAAQPPMVAGGGGGGGRGRGRGVSNLPAWLVEQQAREREAGLGNAPV